MAHAQQAERALPQTAVSLLAAAVAGVLLAGIVAFSTMNSSGLFAPVSDRIQIDPAAVESGRQWELQRKQQSGYVDPVIESGRQWELQRKQQSGTPD
jgi:hypothetical protein